LTWAEQGVVSAVNYRAQEDNGMSLRARLREKSEPTFLRAAQLLLFRSALARQGWIASRRRGASIDAAGRPLPWYTYPAIRFLENRLPAGLDILEYGAGNSTLWWMAKANSVVSIETDHSWAERVKSRLAANAELHLAEAEDFLHTIRGIGRKFDVIVIDGAVRNKCAQFVSEVITTHGVVIWDNSDRQEYAPGFDILLRQGFKKVDFIGMGPINIYEWSTSIFYRPDNLLDL
jgi:hypothetical protein